LTRVSLTKADIDKQNERIRKKYGENVEVSKYVGYEVVRPKEGAKPIFKPIFENPPINKEVETKTEKVVEPKQLSLW
jgi:hypothetical protein